MYNRDGKELGELPKGDMYIRDLKNTKGENGASTTSPANSTCPKQCVTLRQQAHVSIPPMSLLPLFSTDLQAPPTHPPSQLTPELPSTLCAAGHVTNCTGGCWHPTDRTTALTCSEDGTLRVWDVMEVTQKTVIKPQVGIYIVNTAARARVVRLKNLNVERRPGSPLEGLQEPLWEGRRGGELRFPVQVSHFSRLCHVNRHRNSHPQPLSGAAQQANG